MLKLFALLTLLCASLACIAQQPITQPIINRPFTIRPARAVYYPFVVPAGATQVGVSGRFEASGGTGNDVEIYILDEDAVVNWQNGHRVRAYYSSGRMTQGNVNATLPSDGTYYLVFSNRFSAVSNKAVVADISLAYER
jgi:hypothetical protein